MICFKGTVKVGGNLPLKYSRCANAHFSAAAAACCCCYARHGRSAATTAAAAVATAADVAQCFPQATIMVRTYSTNIKLALYHVDVMMYNLQVWSIKNYHPQ